MKSLTCPEFKAVLDFVSKCDDTDFRLVLDNILTQRRMAVEDGISNSVARLDYLDKLDQLSLSVNGGTL